MYIIKVIGNGNSNTKTKKKTKSNTKYSIRNKSNESNKSLLTAIYILLDNTIKTRKYGIIYSVHQ